MSTVNALVTGGYALYHVFILESFVGTDGIFRVYPEHLTLVFASYVGYSVYDMGTMLCTRDAHWSMWPHHIVGAGGAFLMMVGLVEGWPCCWC